MLTIVNKSIHHWNHMNYVLQKIFFYKNIFSYILVFQYTYYLNSRDLVQNLIIYFFFKSPFTIIESKTQVLRYGIFYYTLERFAYEGKFWKYDYHSCNFLLDNVLLPVFSFSNITNLSWDRYKLVQSNTYFFKSDFYFDFYSPMLKLHKYYEFLVKKDLLYYISLLYYLQTIAVKEIYFFDKYNERGIINKTKYINAPNFNINNSRYMYLNFKRIYDHIKIIPQDWSWILFFIVWPFFLFEIPVFFFFEWINYTQFPFAIIPFVIVINWYWIRYFLHRIWMLSEYIRKRRSNWTNFRTDWIDTRHHPVFFFEDFDIVLGSNAEDDPWIWGKVWSYYPWKGGAFYSW